MNNLSFTDLPTREFYDQIVNSVDQNQITIITAETGAGKSTQVPQYLAEHGYDRIIVTQPRILAARNLCKRVREEWAERNTEDSSEIIGYRTAHERDDSGKTTILYCTDGLQLVRELTGAGIKSKQVLVLDEVHEWNENMEVLVAWAKRRAEEDPTFKVVVMSATLDEDSLAEYYGTDAVIKVPGRYFPVTKRTGEDLLDELFKQLKSPGKNILTFLPGKSEIVNVGDALKQRAEEAGVPIIPLHSQLELDEQQKAFGSYPNGKIILSTNIAQTSVTIDDIDIVLDSGLERRNEVRSGVEGLFMAQISQADSLQRAGRAGRTKPGEYILAPFDTIPPMKFEDRPPYSTPEIMRKHIDRLTLRLASIGIDIEALDFYHDPSKASIKQAKRTLVDLGAMTPQGDVTNIGRAMERFPVESSYARMLVAAEEYTPEIQSKLATMIAIQEIGGIVRGGANYTGWFTYTRQKRSDLLAQYDVYKALPTIVPMTYEMMGIIAKNVDKAEEVIARLHRDLGLVQSDPTPITDEEETLLCKAIVAGQVNQLWLLNENGRYQHVTTGRERELSSSSRVHGAQLVSGTPFDLEIPTRGGDLETLHLLQGVTAVDVAWLQDMAPGTFLSQKSDIYYNPRFGSLARRQRVKLGKRLISGNSEPILDYSKDNQKLFNREFSKWAHSILERELFNLSKFHRHVPQISVQEVEQYVKSVDPQAIMLEVLSSDMKRKLLNATKLETYLGDNFHENLGRPRRNSGHNDGRSGGRGSYGSGGGVGKNRRFSRKSSQGGPKKPRRFGWKRRDQRNNGHDI